MIVASTRREPDRVDGAQVAGDEGQVGRFDRDVAGADRDPEIGLRQRRCVVDPVSDHGDDLAGLLKPLHLSRLVARVHLGEHALDPDLAGDAPRGRLRVAGEQHRRQPERPQLPDRLALVGLTVSSTCSLARSSPFQVHAGPVDRHLDTVDDADDALAWQVAEAETTGSTPTSASGRIGDGARDGVLARVLDRAGESEQLPREAPFNVSTPTSRIRPSVTVPVLSSTTVVAWRVCSSTSGPLISTPSCAPRPVPTSSAVGVARPSAHGRR